MLADGRDEVADYEAAVQMVCESGIPSVSMVQRRLAVGYNYAATLMHRMEQAGLLSAPNDKGVRSIVAADRAHQNQLAPEANKFHVGNGDNGKHYWLTPPALYEKLSAEFAFTFDPCPFPKPAHFDGLTADWGSSNYVNPPFGSIVHEGKKKGPTAWARKAIAEQQKGNRVVLVYPIDKWVLMLLAAGAKVRNLGDVRWLATEDGSEGKGTGHHIAAFILEPAST